MYFPPVPSAAPTTPSTTVAVHDDHAVVIKRGDPGAISHERDVLRLLEGVPGVVALAGPPDEPSTLATTWLPGGSLDDPLRARPTMAEAARLAHDIASIIASLHERQVAHGDLDPSHVCFDDTGAPVLVGFARALVGDAGRAAAAEDVAALGRLVSWLAQDSEIPARPTRDRVLRRGGDDSARIRRELRTVAQHACHPDPTRRVTAAAMADRLAAVAVDDGRRVPAASRPMTARLPRRRTLAIIAGVALALLAVVTLTRPSSEDAPTAAPTAAPTTVASTTLLPSTTTSPTTVAELVWPTTSAAPPAAPPVEASAPIVTIEGQDVVVDGQRYRLGVDPADQIVLGDWECDGVITPAVLRQPSGVVDRFDRLPTSGEEVTATRLTPAVPVTQLVTPDACGPVRALAADGTEVTL
jgi:tRNA A-37 threonylcarbamoyl transferase component Bud32